MAKKDEPRLNRDERPDRVILTGRLLSGHPVSITLLPEEFRVLALSPVCGEPCEHLHVLHNSAGDGAYICEVCIGMGRESGGVTKREKEKLPRKGSLHKA